MSNICPLCPGNIERDWSGVSESYGNAVQSYYIYCQNEDCPFHLSIELNSDQLHKKRICSGEIEDVMNQTLLKIQYIYLEADE